MYRPLICILKLYNIKYLTVGNWLTWPEGEDNQITPGNNISIASFTKHICLDLITGDEISRDNLK